MGAHLAIAAWGTRNRPCTLEPLVRARPLRARRRCHLLGFDRRRSQYKPSQFAIGLFVATFIHAILALREVTNEGDGTGQVPGVAIVVAFVLVLVSIAVLVGYVHHIGRALRVSALIELVGRDTRDLVDRVYPDKGPAPATKKDATPVVCAGGSGVLTKIGYEQLVEEGRRRRRGAGSGPRRVRGGRRSAVPDS